MMTESRENDALDTLVDHGGDAGSAGVPAGENVMRVGDDDMLKENGEADAPLEGEDVSGAAPDGEEAATAPDGEDADATPPPAAEKSEMETLRDERDAYLDLARRERADFDNYRKRVQREMRDMKRESLASFLKDFFGPLDDMDRVLQESAKDNSYESLATGIRLMEENFWRVLARVGVKRIDAMGKQFDPNLHEAMTAVPSADAPPNTILEVFENGYKLDDFVLRPARVVVSRAPDAE